ncbi:serine hydrolase domain-containing protein [Paenibacillus sp. GYB003]|uniref:serine hydrolase domain-containing protein n=1 Tax=Paenibacillus sp. GYB003 TaxID=2994392 RepID=UPI002F96916C
MRLERCLEEDVFAELNRYVLETQRRIAASAASVMVVRDGVIVNEWYGGRHDHAEGSRPVDADSQFNVASIRKTFLGFAASLALHEGKLRSIDDPVAAYLDDVDEAVVANTTIRHLLTHTHGLLNPDQRLFPPGARWKYNNAGVHLLTRIVRKLYGLPLARLIEERLFVPYGFTQTGWRTEPTDKLVWVGGSYASDRGEEANMFASTQELAALGYLHLTKGEHLGSRHAPPSVFERTTAVASPAGLDDRWPRNGFFWQVQDKPRSFSELGETLPAGSYQSLGMYGNALLVIPRHNVVAVRMLNQTERNPAGYDYLKDIKTFGDIALKCVMRMRDAAGRGTE